MGAVGALTGHRTIDNVKMPMVVITNEPLLIELSEIRVYSDVLYLKRKTGTQECYRFPPIVLKALFQNFSSQNPVARDIFHEVKRLRESTTHVLVNVKQERKQDKIVAIMKQMPGFIDCFPIHSNKENHVSYILHVKKA